MRDMRHVTAHLVRAGGLEHPVSHRGQAAMGGISGGAARHLEIESGEAVWKDGAPPDPLDENYDPGAATAELASKFGVGGKRMM